MENAVRSLTTAVLALIFGFLIVTVTLITSAPATTTEESTAEDACYSAADNDAEYAALDIAPEDRHIIVLDEAEAVTAFLDGLTKVAPNPPFDVSTVDEIRLYDLGPVIFASIQADGCRVGSIGIPLPLFMNILGQSA